MLLLNSLETNNSFEFIGYVFLIDLNEKQITHLNNLYLEYNYENGNYQNNRFTKFCNSINDVQVIMNEMKSDKISLFKIVTKIDLDNEKGSIRFDI